MDYWVATEYDGDTPDGLLKFEVPASKWAIFEVHGPMPDAMQKAWNQIFSE
jgi:AraC family transcriptional regulator